MLSSEWTDCYLILLIASQKINMIDSVFISSQTALLTTSLSTLTSKPLKPSVINHLLSDHLLNHRFRPSMIVIIIIKDFLKPIFMVEEFCPWLIIICIIHIINKENSITRTSEIRYRQYLKQLLEQLHLKTFQSNWNRWIVFEKLSEDLKLNGIS